MPTPTPSKQSAQSTMLGFEEARQRVISAGSPLESEEVPLDGAFDRVLAEDLSSRRPLPGFDYSAMDGFAVSTSELRGPPPHILPIAGEARAGGEFVRLTPGTALRIYTGAELPEGADAVVIQENTRTSGEHVQIETPVQPGDNVRKKGSDLEVGAVALERGTRLGPFQLSLIAALDRAAVRVTRRARIAIVTTGDELRPPGSPEERGKIPDSNTIAIRTLAAGGGALVVQALRIPDDLEAATQIFRDLREHAEIIVTLGGVSVGKHDVVRAALDAAGAELGFWKVAIKPGKPFTFGSLGSTLVLGLPGNPAAAQITFALFGLPLLRTLHGQREPIPKMERVVLETPIRQKPGRTGIYRATLEGARARLAKNQASGSSIGLAQADALVFVPAEASEVPPGSEVDALRLANL